MEEEILTQFIAFIGGAILLGMLGILAHLGNRHRWARITLYVILCLYALGALAIGALEGVVAGFAMAVPEKFQDLLATMPIENLLASVLALLGAGLFATFILIPPTRRLFFRLIPAQPTSMPHVLGVILYSTFAISFILDITVFYNVEEILKTLKDTPLLPSVIIVFIATMIIVTCGVGLWVSRSWKASLARLGLVPISLKDALLSWGFGIALVGVVFLLSIFVIRPLDPESFALGNRFEEAMRLTGPPLEIFLLGFGIALAAGIGEELLYRGLLQPVVGIVPTAMLFALNHIHYGPSVMMLQLFFLGILFGLIRQKMGTTASILTHASFDLTALVLSNFVFK